MVLGTLGVRFLFEFSQDKVPGVKPKQKGATKNKHSRRLAAGLFVVAHCFIPWRRCEQKEKPTNESAHEPHKLSFLRIMAEVQGGKGAGVLRRGEGGRWVGGV